MSAKTKCILLGILLGVVLGLLTGCIDVSDSKHEVGGEATVRIVVGVDITACNELPPEDKLECITTMLEIVKMMEESQDQDSDNLSGLAGLPTIR